jgi:predicted nucleic acid-binding protein
VLGYTGLLPELHQDCVPQPWSRSSSRYGELGSSLPAEEWVEQRVPGAETLRRVEGEMSEGRGEKEAIALAFDLFALIVLDDKQARNYARRGWGCS